MTERDNVLALADALDKALPIAGPIVAFEGLARQAANTLRRAAAPAASGASETIPSEQRLSTEAAAWQARDERYPYINGIVTDRKGTVEAWREGGIKHCGLYAHPDRDAVVAECIAVVDQAMADVMKSYGATEAVGAHVALVRLRKMVTPTHVLQQRSTEAG